MNIMIAAVGIDPGFVVGGGSALEAVVAFAVVGLILLCAAGHLCRRGGSHHPHAAQYTAPRL